MSKSWIDDLRKYFFSHRHQDLNIDAAMEIKKRHIPSKLYKYRVVNENSLSNFREDTVWCENAANYNDPYDSSLCFSFDKSFMDNFLLESLQRQRNEDGNHFIDDRDAIEIAKSEDPRVVQERYEGTPQGGPLSPLLANVLLDEVDRELERRGHRFVRYADDCNVYVRSQKAGERVMAGLRKLYERLRLKINEGKSAVANAFGRKFLGYALWCAPRGEVKRAVATAVLEALRRRLREITKRNRGRSMNQVVEELRRYLPGWKSYFRLAQTPGVLRELDEWLRHRLRTLHLKHWRRGSTVFREVMSLGASPERAARIAGNASSWWRNGCGDLNGILTIGYFDRLGVPRLS